MKKRLFLFIAAVFMGLSCVSVFGAEALGSYAGTDDVFIRVDRDDVDAWKGELANVRFLQDERMS